MKRNWFAYLALALLTVAMMGCAAGGEVKKADDQPTQKADEVDKDKPKVQLAGGATLDTSKLPPPRAALDDTPDLTNGRFRIDDRAMELMKEDFVPDDVLTKLAPLKGSNFGNAADFERELAETIGPDALAQNRQAIMRNSASMALAVEPAFPGVELKLVALQPEGSIGFGTVFFDFDRSKVKPEFQNTIQANARLLLDNSDMKITIEGHADERGTTEYNLALGERRANAIKDALVSHGVDAGQLSTVSYGEERPAAQGSNEAAWAKNRRGVLVADQ